MSFAPIQPSPSYDFNNEAQFRTQVRQADLSSVKKDEAVESMLWIDQTDGSPYRVTLVSGVFVFTAVVP